MKTTEEKIKEIVFEINSEKKTIQEIVDIMLNNDQSASCVDGYTFDMQELERWKNKDNEYYEIHSHWSISSHRKFIGRFIVFFKKIVRKLLKWYIDPIVEQQNRFNGSVTASINALYNNDVVTDRFIKNNQDQFNTILTRIEELEEQNENLQEEISDLINFKDSIRTKTEGMK